MLAALDLTHPLLTLEAKLEYAYKLWVHSKLRSITHVATKAHMILQSFVVLTWMCDTIELM